MNFPIRNTAAQIVPHDDQYFGYNSEDLHKIKEETTPFLNLDQLKKEERSLDKTRNKIYKLLLAKCHAKIKRTNQTTEFRECFFEIPIFLPGFPVYSVLDAKEFIINQLNLNGVLAADYGENKIYISWKIEDLNYNQYKTYSEKMVPKNNVYKVGVSPLDTRPTPIYPKSNYNNNNRSRNKSKIIGEEGKVSMFQYDERYQDLIPVNTEKLKKQFPQPQKPKKPSFLRNRNQRNYYDKSYDSTSKYPKQTPRFPPRSKRDHRISIDLDDHYLQ